MPMPIGNDTYAYRQRLPHLQREYKTYFVTFCTKSRRMLDSTERDIVLRECIAMHSDAFWLHCAVVMPDHVHVLATLGPNELLYRRLQVIKGRSARYINALRNRSGALWQPESFDRILRRDEDLVKKAEYIANNPVRAGLVERANEYPWLWILASAG
jgi:REP element-mobilizing transposase RayT